MYPGHFVITWRLTRALLVLIDYSILLTYQTSRRQTLRRLFLRAYFGFQLFELFQQGMQVVKLTFKSVSKMIPQGAKR